MPTLVPNPVLLYDGVCGLCDGLVQWVLAKDRNARIRFSSLQSAFGQGLAREFGVPDSEVSGLHTVFLITEGKIFARSEAIRMLLRLLPAPWCWGAALFFFPVSWRDALYGVVARNRYRIFGKRDACRIPTPEEKGRFLE